MKRVDVVVIGAGAAGLFCAAQAGQRGLAGSDLASKYGLLASNCDASS